MCRQSLTIPYGTIDAHISIFEEFNGFFFRNLPLNLSLRHCLVPDRYLLLIQKLVPPPSGAQEAERLHGFFSFILNILISSSLNIKIDLCSLAFFPSDSLPYFYASLTSGVPPERELKLISWLLAADFYFVLLPLSSSTAILIPSMHLKGKLNTQGPVVIKSSVSGLRSPAASLSTADTHRGWPILHYGLSEKESIAASRAVKSVWPPLDFPVRHQSQTEKERQTTQRKKAEQQRASARRLSLCCRLLIGAMCSWQVLWWQ